MNFRFWAVSFKTAVRIFTKQHLFDVDIIDFPQTIKNLAVLPSLGVGRDWVPWDFICIMKLILQSAAFFFIYMLFSFHCKLPRVIEELKLN